MKARRATSLTSHPPICGGGTEGRYGCGDDCDRELAPRVESAFLIEGWPIGLRVLFCSPECAKDALASAGVSS